MKKLYCACEQLFFGITVVFFSFGSFAQPVISYQPVITGLSAPIDIVDPGDGSNRLFIVQQNGIIRVWNGSSLLPTPFLDVSGLIAFGGERGLLSLVFHPSYETNGYFFIYYNNTAGNITIQQGQVTANANIGATTGRVLLSLPKPFTNHNGGKLIFGSDGHLYFGTGDGGGSNDAANNAQNGMSLLGKMIRINVDNFTTPPYYTIPADNPYVSDAAVDDRIWALGLRNPFRWSFDRANGDMWIGDVGQNAKEEVDYRPAGATGHVNYGWRCYEGSISTPGVTDCTPIDNVFPIFDYDNPSSGAAAVTGGYVYRGPDYSDFTGYYIATDVYSGTIYLIRPNGSGGWIATAQPGAINFIVTFGETENGTLYAASQGTNTVYKVVATTGAPLPVTLSNFSVQHFNNYNEVRWSTVSEQNTAQFTIEYSTNNQSFQRVGNVVATRNASGSSYRYRHQISMTGVGYYRLVIEDGDGSVRYSSVVRVAGVNNAGIKIYPTVIRNSVLNIELSQPARLLRMVSSNGRIVLEKNINGLLGSEAIPLPAIAKGLYIVQIIGDGIMSKEKVVIQ